MASVARLVAESRPIAGTLAETYLRHRGIDCDLAIDALRFHPHCPYREPDAGQYAHWPALLSLVTDLEGGLTGLQRTYLSPDGDGKADVSAPRRSLGGIRRHGARFGAIHDVGVFGEGVETVLSLKRVLPKLPMVATLSADNLGASAVPATLRRLYVAVDADAAGRKAASTLSERLASTTLRILRLQPNCEDFNADLMNDGVDALRRDVAPQLLPEDLPLLE